MPDDYVATHYTDTHRCDRCGYEWEDDGGYYYGCPKCAAELELGMSWDAMTPEERRRVKRGKVIFTFTGRRHSRLALYVTPWLDAGLPARDLAGREYVASRAAGDAGAYAGPGIPAAVQVGDRLPMAPHLLPVTVAAFQPDPCCPWPSEPE